MAPNKKVILWTIAVTIIVSIALQFFFGFGLVLIKVLAYLFFAYFLIVETKKWMQINWKVTTTVIIAIAIIAAFGQIVFGKGLDILIWFVCLIVLYEGFSVIGSLLKK